MAKKSITRSNRPATRRVTFTYEDAPGRSVAVAGSFNQWQPRAMADRNMTGVYSVILMLKPGMYEYKFVIDGNWCADPRNPNFRPNDLGSLNSVLAVGEK